MYLSKLDRANLSVGKRGSDVRRKRVLLREHRARTMCSLQLPDRRGTRKLSWIFVVKTLSCSVWCFSATALGLGAFAVVQEWLPKLFCQLQPCPCSGADDGAPTSVPSSFAWPCKTCCQYLRWSLQSSHEIWLTQDPVLTTQDATASWGPLLEQGRRLEDRAPRGTRLVMFEGLDSRPSAPLRAMLKTLLGSSGFVLGPLARPLASI